MVKAENFLPVLRAPPSRGAHSLCIPQKTSPMGNEFLGRKAEKGEGTCRWSPGRRTCAGVWRRRLSACWTRAFHYTVCLLSVSGDLGQQSPDKSLEVGGAGGCVTAHQRPRGDTAPTTQTSDLSLFSSSAFCPENHGLLVDFF